MVWVLVFGGLALLGVSALVGYTFWLTAKARDVYDEIQVVNDRVQELNSLLGRLQLPAGRPD